MVYFMPRLFYHRERTPGPPIRSPVTIQTTLYTVNTYKVTTTVYSNNRHLTVKHTVYFGYIQGFASIAAFSMAVLPHRNPVTPPGHPMTAVVFPTAVKETPCTCDTESHTSVQLHHQTVPHSSNQELHTHTLNTNTLP